MKSTMELNWIAAKIERRIFSFFENTLASPWLMVLNYPITCFYGNLLKALRVIL